MLGGSEILIILIQLLIPVLVIGLVLFTLFRLVRLVGAILLTLQRIEALLRQREQ
jgi:hypothetical protein